MKATRALVKAAAALTMILALGTPGAVSAAAPLTRVEIDGLLRMREAEKLARDVCIVFFQRYGRDIHRRTGYGQQSHGEAIKALLEAHGLADPVVNRLGIFTDPEMQGFFDSLAGEGNESLPEALKACGAIEEIGILDLEYFLSGTRNPDIQEVYFRLLEGAYGHLRAFALALDAFAGEAYQPRYLDPSEYEEILQPVAEGGIGGD